MAAMPLFDAPVSPRLLWPVTAPWPRRRARALIKRFQACFPEITYDMDLNVELINAQAFRAGKQQYVRLYGGLVRHRRIGLAGLAVVLAHESGHHRGGPPYLKFQPWLSSEERSTEWAFAVGLKMVFGPDAAQALARRGTGQLRAIGIVE